MELRTMEDPTPTERQMTYEQEIIDCPACGEPIQLTDALIARLLKRSERVAERELDSIRTQIEAEFSAEKTALLAELNSTRQEVHEYQLARVAMLRRERELDALARKLELEAEERLSGEREAIRAAERERAERDAQRLVRERDERLEVLQDRLDRAESAEAELRRQHLELKAREHALDLEVQRRLEPLRESLSKELAAKAQESATLEIQRREFEINRLREQIAKLSSPTVASEPAGESLETMIRSILVQSCPLDLISDVPKGQKGADLVHVVRNSAQAARGRIVWEAKNTKLWDKSWIEKTKEAQREADAELAVIVSAVLPDGIRHLGLVNGVWLCAPGAAGGLAVLLRHMVLRIANAKLVSQAKDARLQALQDYLASNQFRLVCESIVSTVQKMEEQLEGERKALTRAWERRRQYLIALGEQVVGVIGSLEGAVRHDLIGDIAPADEA